MVVGWIPFSNRSSQAFNKAPATTTTEVVPSPASISWALEISTSYPNIDEIPFSQLGARPPSISRWWRHHWWWGPLPWSLGSFCPFPWVPVMFWWHRQQLTMINEEYLSQPKYCSDGHPWSSRFCWKYRSSLLEQVLAIDSFQIQI